MASLSSFAREKVTISLDDDQWGKFEGEFKTYVSTLNERDKNQFNIWFTDRLKSKTLTVDATGKIDDGQIVTGRIICLESYLMLNRSAIEATGSAVLSDDYPKSKKVGMKFDEWAKKKDPFIDNYRPQCLSGPRTPNRNLGRYGLSADTSAKYNLSNVYFDGEFNSESRGKRVISVRAVTIFQKISESSGWKKYDYDVFPFMVEGRDEKIKATIFYARIRKRIQGEVKLASDRFEISCLPAPWRGILIGKLEGSANAAFLREVKKNRYGRSKEAWKMQEKFYEDLRTDKDNATTSMSENSMSKKALAVRRREIRRQKQQKLNDQQGRVLETWTGPSSSVTDDANHIEDKLSELRGEYPIAYKSSTLRIKFLRGLAGKERKIINKQLENFGEYLRTYMETYNKIRIPVRRPRARGDGSAPMSSMSRRKQRHDVGRAHRGKSLAAMARDMVRKGSVGGSAGGSAGPPKPPVLGLRF